MTSRKRLMIRMSMPRVARGAAMAVVAAAALAGASGSAAVPPPAGVITTVAGSVGGPAAAARVVSPATEHGAAASPGWSVRVSYPNPVTSLAGIACPAMKTCYSVGTLGSGAVWNVYGGVVKTTNGSVWAEQNVLVPFGIPVESLAGVACPSVSTCYAVGTGITTPSGAVMTTTDGGTSWNSSPRAAGLWTVSRAPR